MLAMVLFIAMLVEFLLVKQAGTSTFFLLMIIALVDVLAGFIVGIRSSQRQVEIEGPAQRLSAARSSTQVSLTGCPERILTAIRASLRPVPVGHWPTAR